MTLQVANPPEENPLETFEKEIDAEYAKVRETLKEVSLMLGQSQTELAKLTQRNASITSHLQQVQAQFDTMPRMDIKVAYNAALDAQQRLLVMRGQLDKLAKRRGVARASYLTLIEKIRDHLRSDYQTHRQFPRQRSATGPLRWRW